MVRAAYAKYVEEHGVGFDIEVSLDSDPNDTITRSIISRIQTAEATATGNESLVLDLVEVKERIRGHFDYVRRKVKESATLSPEVATQKKHENTVRVRRDAVSIKSLCNI